MQFVIFRNVSGEKKNLEPSKISYMLHPQRKRESTDLYHEH